MFLACSLPATRRRSCCRATLGWNLTTSARAWCTPDASSDTNALNRRWSSPQCPEGSARRMCVWAAPSRFCALQVTTSSGSATGPRLRGMTRSWDGRRARTSADHRRQGLRRAGGLASTPACRNRATRELACARSGTCVYRRSPSLRYGTRAGRHRDRRGATRAYPPAGRHATVGRGERSGSRYCIQSSMSCRRRSNRSLLAYAASVWLRTTCASAASITSRE